MKKGKRRLIGFTLAAILLVLTACNNNGGKETQPSATSSETASQTGESKKPAQDGKYDPPITLTTVRTVESTVKFADGDSMENNVWTRAYEEEYGIKVKTLWAVDVSQWEQKLNLTIASGDIPDFFRVSATQFKQLAEAGMLADLTDAYNEHASDRVKSLLTEEGTGAIESATIDGKLMAIPFTNPSREGVPMVYIRADWLKALNLPEPKTMEDLLKISEAFATQDPDKNGKPDTYGLAIDKDFTLMNGFFNSFHAYPGILIKDGEGKLTSGLIQPEMKTALATLQKMFKGKQIDPEFGAKDITKVFETVANGKVGIMFYPYYGPLYPMQAGVDKDPTVDWKAFPIMSIDDKPAKSQTALGVLGYWVVKKEVKHPEAVVKMLNFWDKTFYENLSTEVHEKFNTSPDGGNQVWLLNNIAAYKAFKNSDASLQIIDALKTGDTSKLNPENKGVYERVQKFKEGDLTNWGWGRIFDDGGSMSVSNYYRDNDLYVNDEFTTSPLESMVQKGPVLTKLQMEAFTKIILGHSSPDEFDNFAKQWLELGGKEMLADANEWYLKKK
ncbi:extracellular solute-binding protein [Cohnella abietis]|uniref:Lipoprotein LipO n=1 Tax=Cohnella abietis TaxID=2507935 RepID=A0A3T1DEN0_9BACL|nr:extracellular solute-binding protein [Cohnella abietis]BBI36542.1 hypothetical protein KCTCHS21_59410 [Cohnella abietis]